MFRAGETVNYGTTGVCKIDGVCSRTAAGRSMDYYVLKPCFRDNSTVYVPVENEKLVSKMRRILSREEITELISEMPDVEEKWIDDNTERIKVFKEALSSGDRRRIVRLIKSIHARSRELALSNKKLRSSDLSIMNEAEHLLYDEFAFVLNIKRNEVVPFITNQLG